LLPILYILLIYHFSGGGCNVWIGVSGEQCRRYWQWRLIRLLYRAILLSVRRSRVPMAAAAANLAIGLSSKIRRQSCDKLAQRRHTRNLHISSGKLVTSQSAGWSIRHRLPDIDWTSTGTPSLCPTAEVCRLLAHQSYRQLTESVSASCVYHAHVFHITVSANLAHFTMS